MSRPEIRFSRCTECGTSLMITCLPGQRWDDVAWKHVDTPADQHHSVPELRFCIDADCPDCGYYEVGYSPDRGKFTCSRCRWEGDERPADGDVEEATA